MHQHRWATIKRWKLANTYFIIQHCRRLGCDEWIRREINLLNEKLAMTNKPIMQEWKDDNAARA